MASILSRPQCVNGPLWWESTGHMHFPAQRLSNADLMISLLLSPWTFEQIIEWQVNRNALMPMWRCYNLFGPNPLFELGLTKSWWTFSVTGIKIANISGKSFRKWHYLGNSFKGPMHCLNSLSPQICWYFKPVILQCILMVMIYILSIPNEIVLKCIPQNFSDDKSTLIHIMAWCHHRTIHYLSQCWPRSMLSYGIARSQWVEYVLKLPALLSSLQFLRWAPSGAYMF